VTRVTVDTGLESWNTDQQIHRSDHHSIHSGQAQISLLYTRS